MIKHLTLLLLSCALFIWGCQSNGGTATQTATNPNSGLHYWTGLIGKNIPATLSYYVKDGIINGELIYTGAKNPAPIKVLGMKNENTFQLYEFEKDGNITGTWFGNDVTNNVFEGSWFSPTSRKEMKIHLEALDGGKFNDTIRTPQAIDGTYQYSLGKEGAVGNMEIHSLGKDSVIVSFSNVTDSPARNQAEMDSVHLAIKNNKAIYSDSSETGSCKFSIRFCNGYAVVDYIDGKYECGFGNNAYVKGVYLKTGK